MKILYRYSILLLLPASLLLSCGDDFEDKLTGQNPPSSAVDVSERITGFEQEVTGGGAMLTAVGNNLSDVKRVMVNNTLALDVEATDESVTFQVPTGTPLGEQVFHFIFSGNERAVASIEVRPLPTVAYVDPVAADVGETVTVVGNDLDFVDNVFLGDVEATIVSQESDALTFEVPADAGVLLTLSGGTGLVELEEDDFFNCDAIAEQDHRCLPSLNAEFNGDFENATPGVVGEGGDPGGYWFLAGSGSNATYEIFDASGAPGLGDKTLKATVNELGSNFWNIQVVNDGFEVPEGRRFIYSGRIWSDASGRMVRVAGGVSVPGYQDMAGTTDLILSSGWNYFAIPIQHIREREQLETQVRLQASFSFPENSGATFYFDDFRLVDVGERIDCGTDPERYFELYGVSECP
jgi:hypothetical protein